MTSWVFFFFFVPFLAFVLLAVNFAFAPHNPYLEKNNVFECGFTSFFGQNRTQFSISFFIFALLFLLFDLEILLVYPYLVSSYNNETYGLVILLIFLMALTLGFVFELGKKALTIDSRQTMENTPVGTQTNLSIFLFGPVIKWVISWLKYRIFIFFCNLLLKLYICIAKTVVIYLYRNLGIETCVNYLVNWVFNSYKRTVVAFALLTVLASICFIYVCITIYEHGNEEAHYAALRVVVFTTFLLYIKMTNKQLYNLVNPAIKVIIFNDLCIILFNVNWLWMIGKNNGSKGNSNGNNKGNNSNDPNGGGPSGPGNPTGEPPKRKRKPNKSKSERTDKQRENENRKECERRYEFLDSAKPAIVEKYRKRRRDYCNNSRANMTKEQYEKYLKDMREKARKRRANETDYERSVRLETLKRCYERRKARKLALAKNIQEAGNKAAEGKTDIIKDTQTYI